MTAPFTMTLDASANKKIMRKLGKLPRTVARRVLSRSARIAMKPVLKTARKNAPTRTRDLQRSIKLLALKRNRRGNVGVRVAVSEDWFKGPQFYGAFQEFGWKTGKRKGSGPRRQVEGVHYVERAYDTEGESALRRFQREVPQQIEQAMRR